MTERPMTPAEYADAYRYWQQQITPREALEVDAMLEPHVIRMRAEEVQRRAYEKYADTSWQIAQRRRDALADDEAWRQKNAERRAAS